MYVSYKFTTPLNLNLLCKTCFDPLDWCHFAASSAEQWGVKMRIAVIGQSLFGQEVYKELRKDGHTIVGVFTIPDKDGKADPLGENLIWTANLWLAVSLFVPLHKVFSLGWNLDSSHHRVYQFGAVLLPQPQKSCRVISVGFMPTVSSPACYYPYS